MSGELNFFSPETKNTINCSDLWVDSCGNELWPRLHKINCHLPGPFPKREQTLLCQQTNTKLSNFASVLTFKFKGIVFMKFEKAHIKWKITELVGGYHWKGRKGAEWEKACEGWLPTSFPSGKTKIKEFWKTLAFTFSVGGSQFLADLCFSSKSGFCALAQTLWLIEKLVKGLS